MDFQAPEDSSAEYHSQENPAASSNPFSSQDFDPITSMWKVILVLGCASLVATLSLNVYLLKHNTMLRAQREQLNRQLQEFQQKQAALSSMLQDVANFSAEHPEVRSILSKYGITVNVVPPAPPPVPAPPSQ